MNWLKRESGENICDNGDEPYRSIISEDLLQHTSNDYVLNKEPLIKN